MIVRPEFNFFRYSMIVVSVIYLCFSFAHVDYFIATYNLSFENELYFGTDEEAVDLNYISKLSTDAAPAIAKYMNTHYKDDISFQMYLDSYHSKNDIYEYFDHASYDSFYFYFKYLDKHVEALSRDGIRSFNLSHYFAQKMLPQ